MKIQENAVELVVFQKLHGLFGGAGLVDLNIVTELLIEVSTSYESVVVGIIDYKKLHLFVVFS